MGAADIYLAAVKKALRVSQDAFDDEIEDIINAALADLAECGVVPPAQTQEEDQPDPLILRAVKLFAKADFGENEKSEIYHQSYEMQKVSLMLDDDYKEKPDE